MIQIDIRQINDKKRLEIKQYFIGLFKTYSPLGTNITHRNCKDSPTIQFIVPYSGLASKASQVVRKYQYLTNHDWCYPDVMITAFKWNNNWSCMFVSSQNNKLLHKSQLTKINFNHRDSMQVP